MGSIIPEEVFFVTVRFTGSVHFFRNYKFVISYTGRRICIIIGTDNGSGFFCCKPKLYCENITIMRSGIVTYFTCDLQIMLLADSDKT